MKIYLDFDGTLFNTDKFYQDYLKLLQEYNIDELTINNIRPKLFKSSLFNLDILTNYLVKEYNLDIPLREMSYGEEYSIDIDTFARRPRLKIK